VCCDKYSRAVPVCHELCGSLCEPVEIELAPMAGVRLEHVLENAKCWAFVSRIDG